ncbi:MAG: hypothetical protein LBK73_01450 [Treponema sp.]|jgi:hypothetical protein|nr:hypothetical protein [Treponema sp.]
MKSKFFLVPLITGLFLISCEQKIQGIPHLKIDNAPAIRNGMEVSGHIEFYDGGNNYADYRITMALEATRGGKIWAPKPYAGEPSAAIDKDNGKFSCLFVSGGDDNKAERLYVYLIPKGFTPNSGYLRTEQSAIDKVVIERYADGTVDIIYQQI